MSYFNKILPWLLPIFLICGFEFSAYGQVETYQYLRSTQDSVTTALSKISAQLNTKRRAHTFYIEKEWQHCTMQTKDGRLFHFNGRYSVLDNAIEWNMNGKSGKIYPGRMNGASIGNRVFVPIPADRIDGERSASYFEVLEAGNMSLFVRHTLDYKVEGSNGLTSNVNGEKVYFMTEELYYAQGDDALKKLKGGKKRVLKLFENRRDDMETYVESKKIKFNDRKDLRELFNRYNQLSQESD